MGDIEELEEQRLQQLYEKERAEARKDSRLSLPFAVRLPTAMAVSFAAGVGLGLSHGSQAAGLRFRAEHAHKLPTTQQGWFLYHKSKNYHMFLGGIKDGLKMGTKVSMGTAAFFSIEDLLDRYRGTKDFLNTVVASLSVTGGFSLWNQFSLTAAARTARTGLVIGLAYGLVQDALGAARGRRPEYANLIFRKSDVTNGNAVTGSDPVTTRV
ncbi:hypothetical protein BP6252_03829 [Coleophoma cylindrospora]|uniref:Tim17-domain-containing protein n=1 Tax=Coleophoma cylindrospora TaxID=1849047 RepID=A0A3D8S8N3_9HELO|nr:hypothetical protein BP6252_03829 [Coleophoma cylindrospora]